MPYSPRQIRVVFLVMAGVFAGCAMFVRFAGILPSEPTYVVSGDLRSALLPGTISFYSIEAIVGSVPFQGAVGAKVSVEADVDDSRQFRLYVHQRQQPRAEDAFNEAQELLKLKLRSLAVSEVEASKAYVDDLRGEARQWEDSAEKSKVDEAKEAKQVEAVSEEDAAKAIRLRQEIQAIRAYLNGGKEPEWLTSRLDREALSRVEAKLIKAKAELYRLTTVYQPGSRTVAAQNELLRKAKASRRASVRFLAKSLLDSDLLALRSLESKSLARIESNSKADNPRPADEVKVEEHPTDAAQWLTDHSKKLSEKAKRLELQSTLDRVGDLDVRLARSSGYWATMVLWIASLLCLIGALSNRGRFRSPKSGSRSLSQIGDHRLREPGVVGAPRPSPDSPGIFPESFFLDLRSRLEQEFGRLPSKILVLGTSVRGERSSLTLRLAKNFSSTSYRVRLIDFDFKDQLLSQRLGDKGTLGVADLLSHAGPVDEFFASLPGTSIEFAPAGISQDLQGSVSSQTLTQLFKSPVGGLTLVDASFHSPLHLLVDQVEAVLCLTSPGVRWERHEEEVLLSLREARVPVWGFAHGDSRFFPYI